MAIDRRSPIDPRELTEIADLSVELAVEAGHRARDWRAEGFTVDVEVDADRSGHRGRSGGSSAGSRAQLRHASSRATAWSGEEGAADAAVDAVGVRWLVDPIDGTVNFALGLPQYGVSIAAEVDGRVVAGCVVNPVTGDVFRAVPGAGLPRRPADRRGAPPSGSRARRESPGPRSGRHRVRL